MRLLGTTSSICGVGLLTQTWGLLACVLTILGVAAFCRHASFRCRQFLWPYLLVLTLLCRVGEATNPGPGDASLTLGAFNPSGLKGKGPCIVSQLEGDLWAISETHLCLQSLHAFRSSLRFAGNKYQYCIAGHPVPAQDNRVFHAAWRGVAVLSKFPTRAVPHQMPPGIFESSRTLITTTLLHGFWITGGVVYGEPDSCNYPQQKVHNEELIHHVANQVCHLHQGPRFLAGDWNNEQHTLPVFEMIEAAGFRDLQDLASDWWGRPVSNTCKQATRKDFCYVSRELQQLLVSVSLQHDVFPDHSVLIGEFSSPKSIVPRQIWVSPGEFPWPRHWNVDPEMWSSLEADPDEKYHLLWQHIEQQARNALPYPVDQRVVGRAAVRNVKPKLDGKIPPPKQARKGDVRPHYVCASFRHSQWLRQLRRLQAYVRHVGARDSLTAYATQVWGSVIRATGFNPSFCEWWTHSGFRSPGALEHIPLIPPSFTVAQAIFESFALAFRSFENDLDKASRHHAKLRREANPNVIFQDLKAHTARDVNVLIKPVHAVVETVDPLTHEVVLTHSAPFTSDKPAFCNGSPVTILHAEADAVWVDDVEGIAVGDAMTQMHMKGTDDELFHLFLDAWKAMWERHANVPPSRWDNILGFARDKLKRHSFHWPAMDRGSLAASIGQKHSRTTGGLDGVSLLDLKAMPGAALDNFVSMFRDAEKSGSWPTQVVAGRVSCLAKVSEPQSALDFRPITVFSLLYRCWGTYHARQAIKLLDTVLPVGLYGSRPQCYSGQLWSHLLWSVEMAHESQSHLSGIMADVQKAFNFLPRAVVLECCALLGLPFPVLCGWAGALNSMTRRFQINGSLSPPALSNCGLPEGCALSCVGMMVIDIIFHEWMLHFFPLCQPLSYVDDWQILVADPNCLKPVFECLEQFTQAIDLQLDQKKTHVWSVSSSGRKILRQQGFGTVAYSKSLGAHVQFTKQHTNSHLIERVRGAGFLWNKLRLSASPYAQKIRALKCAAWPRCLHAVAATAVSQATFASLRTGAMRGLRADSAGANAMVHLGLTEPPGVDPCCWSIMQTFRLVRDCGIQPRVEEVLVALVGGNSTVPLNGITSTLLQRIQFLGWHVDTNGLLHDMLGPFSMFQISAAELQFRVEFQWPWVVQAAVQHRPCFQGLKGIDPVDTRTWLATLEVSDRALFCKLLNGSHITQDGKHYCQQEVSDVCPFCQCSDSRFHRFWQCEQFEQHRVGVPAHVRDMLVDMPEVLTCAGWSLAPTTMIAWNRYFAQLQCHEVPHHVFQGDIDIFTDGSCHDQHCISTRFAGWAVIVASTQAVHDYTGSFILDAGVLPGLLQSSVRAEIFAVLRALQITEGHQGTVRLWSDCDFVVKRVCRLLQGAEVKPNSSHSDLWLEIAHCLQTRQGRTCITHVSAHQPEHRASNVMEGWCYRHNALVDKQAVLANLSRPQDFWKLHVEHVQALEAIGTVNRLVQGVQLAISKEVVYNDQPDTTENAPQVCHTPVPSHPWRQLPELSIPGGATRWYGDSMVRLLLSWFWQTLHQCEGDLVWVSHFQLYIDFMCCTGHPGPIHLSRWCDGDTVPNVRLRGFSFRQRARWFAKVWKQCLKHLNVTVDFAYCKPMSHIIVMFTGCAALPWPEGRLRLIDDWMMKCAGGSFKRQTRAIDALPFADPQPGFPQVFLSSSGT